jgi:hypothetical protein
MSDHPIHDAKGTLIEVGCVVLPYKSAAFDIPGGVVVKIEPVDVDFNDDTGRAEGFGPFVHVRYADGEEDRWTAYNKRDWYTAPDDWVCDDITVEPLAKT